MRAVRSFYGGYLDLEGRRVWVIARPPGGARELLRGEIVDGSASAASAALAAGGQIALSRQIAAARHVGVGDRIAIPTPERERPLPDRGDHDQPRLESGRDLPRRRRLPAATGRARGADARSAWSSPRARTPRGCARRSCARSVRRADLEVATAPERTGEIDALAGAGLSRLGEISTLLTIAAILALATALASAIWQRRVSLAELRLTGVTPARLRKLLLLESTLLLGAGCVTGAIVGVYGQAVIDGYLRNVTGFPIVTLTAGLRPLELLALVVAIVLVLVAVPGFLAARVPPTLALEE